MRNNIRGFIHELRSFQSTANVFNPWRDYDENLDLYPEVINIRTKQIEHFLNKRLPGAKYLLVAEAIGYQGGRFTGVALTSERIVLKNAHVPHPANGGASKFRSSIKKILKDKQ